MNRTRRLLAQYATAKKLTTQGQIARALGITKQSVSLLLSEQRTISAEVAEKMATELGLDMAKLVRELAAERSSRSKRVLHGGVSSPGNAGERKRPRYQQNRLF